MASQGKDSSEKISLLRNNLENKLSGKILDVVTSFGELTITISDKAAAESFLLLRDNKEFSFDTLVDLCGLDCSGLKEISEKFEIIWLMWVPVLVCTPCAPRVHRAYTAFVTVGKGRMRERMTGKRGIRPPLRRI